MHIKASKYQLNGISHLRLLYLTETNCQIRYNACHERGWSDLWLLSIDGLEAGYGAVKGLDDLSARDAVFEFYVLPPYRQYAHLLFEELLGASGAVHVESQTNDLLTTAMLYEFADGIRSEVVLFEDHATTNHQHPDAVFRRKNPDDQVFGHQAEPVGDFILEQNGEIVASAGFLLHYNPPFADLYMEVREDCRRQGLGSFIIQEVKKACYEAGRVPAARTGIHNRASRATLSRAGMRVCGYMLAGEVKDKDR